jgi:phosphoserine phosphatase
MNDRKILLIAITGKDRPGITARLSGVIAEGKGRLIDLEQVVTQHLLSLSILIEVDSASQQNQLIKDLLFAAHSLALHLDFKTIDSTEIQKSLSRRSYVVTCLGPAVTIQFVAKLSQIISEQGANIEKIAKLSPEDASRINCFEMLIVTPSPLDPRRLTRELFHLNAGFGVDIAVQQENLYRRAKRLIVMDMDSTLVQMEGIDELAKEAGVGERVADITRRAMNGDLSFTEVLRERVGLLKDLPVGALDRVYQRISFTPGGKEMIGILKKLGYKTAVLSGGFDYFTDRIKEELRLDYTFSNRLDIKGGKLTGEILGEIVDGKRKAELMEEIAKK